MTDRILEIGEAGLETADEKVKKLMDNMVGSEVPGYRKSDVVVESFPLALQRAEERRAGMKPEVSGSFYSNIQGALVKTDRNLDLALGETNGLFVVQGSWGYGYTRDGRFYLDKEGRLLTVAGNLPVMGQSGPIVLNPGAELSFSQTGQLMVDGIAVDTIRVVKPEKLDDLTPLSGSLFKAKDQVANFTEIETPRVIQGYIEASNVSVIDSMMEMIYLQRYHDLNTKIIQTRDGNLGRAMELGRVNQ